ncbi:16S rRNA processing protein RimM [Deinococcus irradiatisoli]|uniref:Ribosome maturation factor RimM n=1 Tax=Deinococcus irradiatisoli TaxID=2202254 RepID=A0A2Z3JLW3_9DEIO|nr:ribosome maturation factor RimM [Deinococcus irradiatisoli]AWN23819.1 16S rRNA processing protein RimM [Deinococcus irradiatisoli]
MSAPDQTTRVGYVLGPHGVAGAVKLYVIGSAPQLSKLKRLYIEGQGWTRLLKFEMHGPGPVLTLGGVTDRNAAEALRGRQVYAHDKELPPLPEGEYYYHELRGLKVRDAAGQVLGEVSDVIDAGHQDLLVVRSLGGTEGMIPLQAPYVEVRRGSAIVLTEDAPMGLLGDEPGDDATDDAGDQEAPGADERA